MSLTDNGFVRFCLSGFGLGATPARALGIAILVVCSGLIVAYYVLKFLFKLIMKFRGKSVPDFKEGPYCIEIAEAGATPDVLYEQMLHITGYDASLAKKVINNTPAIAICGLDNEAADDFKTILEAKGAKVNIIRKK
ncbi:MAG: hypothetical protein J6K19_11760 [Prevotella sp.]|nr:hypothetical protein [Prevotella sp.]